MADRFSHEEMAYEISKRPKRAPEYGSWSAMKTRCLNPNSRSYHQYGGAGVTICNEWMNSFAAFLRDMGPKPSAKHTIDRIDNRKGYEPGNCRWATPTEQSRNRERCFLTLNGVRKPIREWASLCGVSVSTISNRKNAGLPDDLIIAPPTPRGDRNHLGFAMRPRVSQ